MSETGRSRVDASLEPITIADAIKEDAQAAVDKLKALGVNITMLSGDKSAVVKYVGYVGWLGALTASTFGAGSFGHFTTADLRSEAIWASARSAIESCRRLFNAPPLRTI